MIGEFINVKIKGITSVVPKDVEDNIDYAELVGEKRVKRQIKLTGVERRHVPNEYQKTSDLCTYAAEELIKKLDWNKDSIKYLILVTQIPDFEFPATSLLIQKRLGIGKDCLAFDVNLGCSGYVAGIQILSALLQSNGGRGILMVGDIEYRTLEERNSPEYANQITDDMLFGAAATATAIEFEDGNRIDYMQNSNGEGYDVILRKKGEFTQMDGSAVFSFTMEDVADSIKLFRKQLNLQEDNIDFYVFHQAQKMILENLADICDIKYEKVLSSLKEYGNTSSASIPLTICVNREKYQEKESINIYMCGFGVGLSWGSIYIALDTNCIFDVIETDKYYVE